MEVEWQFHLETRPTQIIITLVPIPSMLTPVVPSMEVDMLRQFIQIQPYREITRRRPSSRVDPDETALGLSWWTG